MKSILFCLAALFLSSYVYAQSSEHMMHHHGAMARAMDCSSVGWSDKVSSAQQKVINETMGSRSHRLHHALWHATRGGLNPSQSSQLVTSFGPTWTQSHALCPAPQNDASAADYNPSGEDFFYMHREMIQMLQAALIAAGQPCIKGWDHVPTRTEWPMPSADANSPYDVNAKSDETLQKMSAWDKFFRNTDWLRGKSLSQVGWALEMTLHNTFHMRYATPLPPTGFKDAAPIGFDGNFPADWKFDSPSYNWLADPYGAALNPTFWKIHGYVDSIIDAWLAANGYATIASNCTALAKCYQWQGQWVGEVILATPRLSRGQAQLGGSKDMRDEDAIREFTLRRLALQRIGVPDDSTPRSVRSSQPQGKSPDALNDADDPFMTTKQSVCP